MEKLLRLRKVNEDIIARYVDFIKNKSIHEIKNIFGTVNESKLFTMIHGDFWSNNMLFNETDDKVKN
jgi:hypothetical protein